MKRVGVIVNFIFSWKQKTQKHILARCSFDNLRFNGQNNVIHTQENVFYFNLNSFEKIHKMISFSTNSFFLFSDFFFADNSNGIDSTDGVSILLPKNANAYMSEQDKWKEKN